MFRFLNDLFYGYRSDLDRKPPFQPRAGSVTLHVPDNTPPEVVQRMMAHAVEKSQLSTMSPREQLEYLKKKTGLE